MLWIKAKGGLGNRMLSTASGIIYAKATNRDFVIDWCDGVYSDINVNAYHELFSAPFEQSDLSLAYSNSDVKIIPDIWKGKLHMSVSEMISQFYPKEHSNPFVYRKLIAPLEDIDKNCSTLFIEVFWAYTSKLGRIKKFLPKPHNSSQDLLREIFSKYFIPCAAVQKSLKNESVLLKNKKILGVHIRYTDLKAPLPKLLKKIRICMDNKEYQHIFLATDNSYVQEKIYSEFPSVTSFQKRYPKNSFQLHTNTKHRFKGSDSQSAVLDMYALAQCDGLLYSSRSSFARISHILGKFNQSNSYDIDQYNLRVRFKHILQEYL